MKKLIVLLALMVSQGAAASEFVVASNRGFSPVAVKIERRADYAAVPLTIEADISDPIERLDATNTAIDSIRKAISAVPGLETEVGAVSISPRKSSTFSSSSSGSSVTLYVLGGFSDGNDVFAQTKKIYRAVSKIELPDDVSMRLGYTRLGMRNPEDYRAQLLNMIRDQIKSTKEALGAAGDVTVRGLENAVLVSEKNASDIVLYMNYTLEVVMEK